MRSKKGYIFSILLGCFIIGVSIPLFMTNHKKMKADTITNLTNTKWELNSECSSITSNVTYNINFTYQDYYDTHSCISLIFVKGVPGDYPSMIQYTTSSNMTNILYSGGNLMTPPPVTIEITGGNDITNSNLISWLQNNATQQINPLGTEITHKYWASYLDIQMTNNEVIADDYISYKVLWNEYTDDYNEQTLTGLAFTGVLTSTDEHSHIYSINGSNLINLYQGDTNTIDNTIWLEFTTGDYMNTDLYNLMDERGVWFDDASVYLAGTNLGSIYGFNRGVAYGEANATQYTSLITNILNGLGNILRIQVFPNITIALIIGLPLLLGVLVIVLKILRG